MNYPLTPYKGLLLPGLYNWDGPIGFGLRKERVKRLFSTPFFESKWLEWVPYIEFGLNRITRNRHFPNPVDKFKPEVFTLLEQHYDLRITEIGEEGEELASYRATLDFEAERVGKDSIFLLTAHSNIDGGLVGNASQALMLLRKGIAPQKRTPDSLTCSIGFCDREQKWYGWSHRAMYGFGIGHKTKKGDCGYITSDTRQLLSELKQMFSEPYYVNPSFDVSWRGITVNYGPPGDREGEFFPLGKGEWTAETLEDAKQMAMDFAEEVS